MPTGVALASLAAASLALLGGCKRDGFEPFSNTHIYEISASDEHVRNEVFEYTVNAINADANSDHEFEIVNKPPLVFEFPRTYFYSSANHDGGTVGELHVFMSRKTWLPMGAEKIARKARVLKDFPTNDGMKQYAAMTKMNWELDRKTVHTRLYALQPAIPVRTIRENAIGKWIKEGDLLFQIYGHKERVDWFREHAREKVFLNGVDISDLTVEIIPDNASRHAISRMFCIEMAPKCQVHTSYHGHRLVLVVYRTDLKNADFIINNVKRIYEKYRRI